MHTTFRRRLAATTLAAALALAACGDDDPDVATGELPTDDAGVAGDEAGGTRLAGSPDADEPDTPMGDEPAPSAMCLPDAPDCEDTVASDGGEDPDASIDEAAEIAEAEALLGTPEADLPDDVRIARRGEESFALTEDYVLGRDTVVLEDRGEGFVVVEVVVELTEGPYTATL